MPTAKRKSAPKISREPVRAFISYSNRDRAFLEQLVAHLQPLVKERLLALDYDLASLKPGDPWETDLPRLLSEASIVLFLVSPDSLSSDFVQKEVELSVSQQQQKRIVPILLRPCDWYRSPLAHYSALPTGAKPIAEWKNRDEAFADIARELRRVVESLDGTKQSGDLPQSHGKQVHAIAISPDGRQIVSAGDDGLAIVWDGSTLKPTAVLAGHSGAVFGMDVSPDGRLAATGSQDGSIKVWDLSSGTLLRTLVGHGDVITVVAFSGDGRWLISVSMDRTARVWNVEVGSSVHVVQKNRYFIDIAVLSGSGLVVFSAVGEALVFDLPSLKEVLSFPMLGHRLCPTPDGRLIAWDPTGFEVRSLPDGQLISVIQTNSVAKVVRALPNGRHAISAHGDSLRLWDLTNGALIRSVNVGTESPTALAVTPDGARAIWGSERGGIYSWPIEVSVSRAIPSGHDRLRLAYLAVLESPELWRILETWDESALAGIGPQVGCPPDQDVLEMLTARHADASPPALWAAWMETLHKTKLGKPPEVT